MLSFRDMMASRQQTTEALKEKIENNKNKKFQPQEDTRFWQPTLDAGGQAAAKIRFLPPKDDLSTTYVKMMNFAFQGPIKQSTGKGMWYIENSLQTIGQDDPCQQLNNALWAQANATGNKKYETQAKSQRRNIYYISNILVIEDKQKPENNGKVFLFRYGEKIYEKIQAKMFPDFEDEQAINVFDFEEGADFKIKVSLNKYRDQVSGREKENRDWSKCEFESVSSLYGGDVDKLQKVYDMQYSLTDFLKPDNFKSYDALLKRLEQVFDVEPGTLFSSFTNSPISSKKVEKVDLDDSIDHIDPPFEPQPVVNKGKGKASKPAPAPAPIDEDDDDDFFSSLSDD